MPKKYPKGFFDFLPQKIDEAIKFIQEHEPPEGYFLGNSGGKDSSVLEDITRISGVKYQSWYSQTTIDPPEIVRFIKKTYPYINIWTPKRSFWNLIQTKNPPTFFQRWCCNELKKGSSRASKLSHLIMGMRAEESTRRGLYQEFSPIRKMPGKYYVLPLLNWNEADIWQYIDENNIPYCSLYDEGFSRLGCIICPMRSFKEHELYRIRWPGIYKVFEKSVIKWWNKRKSQGYDMADSAPQEYIEKWYLGEGDYPYKAKDKKIHHGGFFN